MVRRAIAAPPGPVVSCPTNPRERATSSSITRPWSPPTLMAEKTKLAPEKASSASAVMLTMPGKPRYPASSTASRPVVWRRTGSGSNRLISSKMLVPLDSTARTNAGMRTPPPPRTASFIVGAFMVTSSGGGQFRGGQFRRGQFRGGQFRGRRPIVVIQHFPFLSGYDRSRGQIP